MQLPNKLYSYEESTLAMLPVAMRMLTDGPVDLTELYGRMKPLLKDATDFLPVMDCLYALRKVDINDDGEVYIC